MTPLVAQVMLRALSEAESAAAIGPALGSTLGTSVRKGSAAFKQGTIVNATLAATFASPLGAPPSAAAVDGLS